MKKNKFKEELMLASRRNMGTLTHLRVTHNMEEVSSRKVGHVFKVLVRHDQYHKRICRFVNQNSDLIAT